MELDSDFEIIVYYAGWQAFMAARNALQPGASRGVTDWVPWTTFTDPEVAHIGLTEASSRPIHLYLFQSPCRAGLSPSFDKIRTVGYNGLKRSSLSHPCQQGVFLRQNADETRPQRALHQEHDRIRSFL